jgi:type I restriction enzyme M protein
MTQEDIIQTTLKDSNYHLDLFSNEEITALREKIIIKETKSKKTPFVPCIVRDKNIQLKPEEIVRQLYAARLIQQYGYPKKRLTFEYPVTFGREKKSADIVVFDKDRPDTPYIIVELKKPKLKDGKDQLRSYCNATGAPMSVWTNGEKISHYHRKDPNYFEDITDIPKASQSLKDILSERFTLKDLIIKDKIANERKSLKDIILEMEDEVLANAGVDVFEEVFKLIFTKLYDEFLSRKDKDIINYFMAQVTKTAVSESIAPYGDKPNYLDGSDYDALKAAISGISDEGFRVMEFRNSGQTDTELKHKIQSLFNRAKNQWPGVFAEGVVFDLSDSHLSVCVSSLQDVKLFNSNLLVVDEAFEYLVNKSAKGEKGQYFTPRHIIDMCVKMLNPKRGEYMIDTASGSCGFPVHTIFQITGHLFTNAEISERDKENVLKVFGIDFDEKTVRVARTLNLIAGDGETNVLHLNALDYERWSDKTEKDKKWINTYGKGFERLEKLRVEKSENKYFNFDILMANPPFAGDIKESRILHQYELTFNDKRKAQSKVGRDILFIERNLDFLKPGGRMAIVLPQGRFNNTTDKYIREFIAQHGRILAVVGLHGNTFKPHTGTKTSVLFVQKWDDRLCPKVEDYPIFFAVSEKGGKDNSGDYIYVKNGNGQYKLDRNGHMIVDHDLHNHNGELPDGIAEAFIKFAKAEKLSFWVDDDSPLKKGD